MPCQVLFIIIQNIFFFYSVLYTGFIESVMGIVTLNTTVRTLFDYTGTVWHACHFYGSHTDGQFTGHRNNCFFLAP